MLKLTPQKSVLLGIGCKRFSVLKAFAVCTLAMVGVAVTFSVAFPSPASAAPSNTINFQARLESAAGAIAADGNYNVEFKLHTTSASSGGGNGACTGDCVWMEDWTYNSGAGRINKDLLISQEADKYLPEHLSKYGHRFSIKDDTLIPDAGIDESNAAGNYVRWPKDAQKTCNDVRAYLMQRFSLKEAGVIITDSTCQPLRR